jgi:hypothetical protein
MEKKYIKALDVDNFDHQLYNGDNIKIHGEETTITGFSAQYNDGIGKWETIIHTIGRGDPFERSLDVIEVLEDQPRSYEKRCALPPLSEPILNDDGVKAWEADKQAPTGAVWVKATVWPADHNMVHWRRALDKKPLLVVGRNDQDNIIAQFGGVYTPEELEWLDESGDNWTSVNEQLPEIGEYVLVYNTEHATLVGRLMSNGWVAMFADGENFMGELTAVYWRKLPAAPRGR